MNDNHIRTDDASTAGRPDTPRRGHTRPSIRACVTARLRGREESLFHRRTLRVKPVVHCDNQASRRYTILDIIADDALGLLYRISRVISQNGCEIDLVLIATEGHRAIDVFHITKAGAKLSDADSLELSAHLQQMLEGTNEAH